MSVAVVGLPAGLTVSADVLESLRKAGRFDHYEIRGRELVLYWRGLAPRAQRTVVLDCVARIPGTTVGPASRTYLYYADDQKRWAAPLAVTIKPVR